MTLHIPAKVLHVWSYDFYGMTLSTGKQRRHMINHISFNDFSFIHQPQIDLMALNSSNCPGTMVHVMHLQFVVFKTF